MTEIQNRFLDFCRNEKPDPFIPTESQSKAIFGNINIVAAGAGSGKTAVLAHRFLYLVMSGIHADEILTLTFTKDATASMKKKIYQLLKKAVEESLIDEKELEKFSASTISTTDGFCSEIAKSASADYGISPKFRIESSESLEKVSDQITEEVLKNHQNDPRLKLLLSVWSVSNVQLFMQDFSKSHAAISRPTDFGKLRNYVIAEYSDYTEAGLKLLIDEFLEEVEKTGNLRPSMEENKRRVLAYSDNPDIGNLILIMKLSKASGSADIKQMLDGIMDYARKLSCVHPASQALSGLISELCTEYQNMLFRHKRETGFVTYRDVLMMALDILTFNDEIRSYYQNKFKAIMVDEFQDNNEDNKTLVYLIAGEKTDSIFMVGDEKQSIYRFRDADVSVFKKMSEDFDSDHVVQLQRNYRSLGSLIDIINRIFENVMSDANADYEASYTALESEKEGVSPKVVLYYNESESSKNTLNSEAENIAGVISEILNEKKSEYRVIEDGKIRDPQPGDIAVLLKVGTHQIFYEKALRNRAIPFEAVENKSFTIDAVANDFYNVLQLAVWGLDDGLAWNAFRNSPLGKNIDDSKRKDLISDIRTRLATSPIAEVISYIWNDLGYRFFILRNKKNHRYSEHFDFLFTLAAAFDRDEKTIVEFLDYLRPMLGDECKIKEVEIQREKESGVKIMTIHKSKGLEFPIVIIPDMQSGSTGHGGFKSNIKEEKGLFSFPCAFVNNSKDSATIYNPLIDKDDESEKDFAETKRVMYVAATRAQFHLIFSGIIKKTSTGDYGKNMMGCLLRAVHFDDELNRNKDMEYIPYGESEPDNESGKVSYTEPCDSWYENNYDFKFRMLTSAITSLDIDRDSKFDNPLPLFESDGLIDSWTDFGTHVHSLLERTLNNLETEKFYGCYENNPNREIIHGCALQMRDNFINSGFFKSLKDYEKYTERGFFYCEPGSPDVMEGIVDLLCVGKDKVIIVDYKTDKFMDPTTHKGQMETYIKAMKEKFGKPVEAYLFYVRSATVKQI